MVSSDQANRRPTARRLDISLFQAMNTDCHGENKDFTADGNS